MKEWVPINYPDMRKIRKQRKYFREKLPDLLLLEFVGRKALYEEYMEKVHMERKKLGDALFELLNRLFRCTADMAMCDSPAAIDASIAQGRAISEELEKICGEIPDYYLLYRTAEKVFAVSSAAEEFCAYDEGNGKAGRAEKREIEKKEAERMGFVLVRGLYLKDMTVIDLLRGNDRILKDAEKNWKRFGLDVMGIRRRILGEAYGDVQRRRERDSGVQELLSFQERVEEIREQIRQFRSVASGAAEEKDALLTFSERLKGSILFGGQVI